jgi:hypothetical protein
MDVSIKDSAVVLVAAVDLSIAAILIGIMVSVWSDVRHSNKWRLKMRALIKDVTVMLIVAGLHLMLLT